jgi:tetratricopeptide (TPR) repeat protein
MAEAAVLGAEQLDAGNLESAVIIFEGLVTAEPKIPQFRVSLGQCYEKLGFNEEALESYASALILYAVIEDSKYEDILDAALLRATLMVKLDREVEAIEDLTRVVPPNVDLEEAPPALVQSYIMLMNLLEKAAKREEEMAAEGGSADAEAAPEAATEA